MHRTTIEWIYDVGRRARDKHREDEDLDVEYRETRSGFDLDFNNQGKTLVVEEVEMPDEDKNAIHYELLRGVGAIQTEDTIGMPEDQGVLEEFALHTIRHHFR